MFADGERTAAVGQTKPQRRPISRAHIEVVISRSVAVFGLAFGAQTVPVALGQRIYSTDTWFLLIGFAMFGGLVIAVIASAIKRFVKLANVLVASVFLVAMITWPIGVVDPWWSSVDRPWIWFLITVATAAAAVAFPVWLATFYLLLAPLLYGVIRSSPTGGAVNPSLVSLDVIYAVILGGAVLIIVTMLRGAAASVDVAQATALGRYVDAVREHAIEVERVQVDSIVHDSVLTTLLSAAHAHNSESQALAATMAKNAIGHLQEEAATPTVDTSTVSVLSLAQRLGRAASTLSSSIDVRMSTIVDGVVPGGVAEALYAAGLQAMVNSLQHAGGSDDVSRWVSVSGVSDGGVLIEVGDTGRGFALAEVPVERLGLRLSIMERVSNAGGAVEVDSVLGEGAAIRIRWPVLAPHQLQSQAQEGQAL